ncbi:MAG TPA: glycerophosphodiester phosphodiesterase [Dehalococcoidia bacterium]|nr:glycerophosphodiester phosphodiesterase [Dehalococcoidia bacterium]
MIILGHRGARRAWPENTLDALRAALDAGADGVEFDVHLTRDGVAVLHHDPTLERMTGRSDRIADLAWSDLRALTEPSAAPVVALADVLTALGPDTTLDIEIKAPGAERVAADLLQSHPQPERVALSSFDPAILASLRALGSPITRWLNSPELSPATIDRAVKLEVTAIVVPVEEVTPRGARLAQAAGLRVGCWGFDDADRVGWLRETGCDIAIPDLPWT